MAKRILVDQLKPMAPTMCSTCRAKAISLFSMRFTRRAADKTITCRHEGNAAMMAEVCMESSPTAPASAW